MTFSVLTIQKYIRGWIVRKNTRDLKKQKKRAPMAPDSHDNGGHLVILKMSKNSQIDQPMKKCPRSNNDKLNESKKYNNFFHKLSPKSMKFFRIFLKFLKNFC